MNPRQTLPPPEACSLQGLSHPQRLRLGSLGSMTRLRAQRGPRDFTSACAHTGKTAYPQAPSRRTDVRLRGCLPQARVTSSLKPLFKNLWIDIFGGNDKWSFEKKVGKYDKIYRRKLSSFALATLSSDYHCYFGVGDPPLFVAMAICVDNPFVCEIN